MKIDNALEVADMRSTGMIRAAKLGYIVLSAVNCAVGMWMIAGPGIPVDRISVLLGALTVAFGIIKLIGYFSRDLYRLAFQHDLALGLLLIALGLALALKSGWALSLLSLTLGIMTITDGLFKVQTSLDAKRFGLQNWWLMLALAVLAGAAGAALIVWPFKGMGTPGWLLGMCLIALGILNLCVALCAVKIIAHQQPDVI